EMKLRACLLLRVKQTSLIRSPMSANDQSGHEPRRGDIQWTLWLPRWRNKWVGFHCAAIFCETPVQSFERRTTLVQRNAYCGSGTLNGKRAGCTKARYKFGICDCHGNRVRFCSYVGVPAHSTCLHADGIGLSSLQFPIWGFEPEGESVTCAQEARYNLVDLAAYGTMIKFVVFEGRFDFPGTYIVFFYFLNGHNLSNAHERKEKRCDHEALHEPTDRS